MLKHHINRILFSLLLLVSSLCGYAQFSGVKWEQRIFYETPTGGYYARNPSVKKVIQVNSNETVIVWQLTGDFLPYSQFVYVQKINANGKQIWETELFHTGGFYTPGFCDAVVTNDGGIVVLSMTEDTDFGYDLSHTDGSSGDPINGVLYKVTRDGIVEWQRYIKGKRREIVTALDLDRFGNILVSGRTWSAYDDFASKRRYVDSSYWSNDTLRFYYYQHNNDAFIAKFSTSGDLINLKCYGGSLSDQFIHIQDHPVYGYVAIGYSESKDYDLPAQGTNNGIWMVHLDTSLNITQQIILDSSDTFFSHFFIKNKRLFLSNSSTFRELGFDGTMIREHGINNILFDQHSFFDKSGYIFSPVQDKRIHVYDSSLQLVHSLQLPGVDHGYYLIDGTSRNNIYLIGKAKHNYTYVYGGYISYQVHSNAVLNFSDSYNYITGKIFADANSNNQFDVGEKIVNGVRIQGIKDTLITSFVHEGADDYYLNVDTGTYFVKPVFNNPYYTFSPVSKSVYFPLYDNSIVSADFALQPLPNKKKDLSINLLPLNIARPGFPVQYQLICTNQGTETISNVQVKFVQNPRVSFVSASPVINTTVGDTLIWNIASMKPFDTTYINLDLRIAAPPAVNNTDTLLFKSFAFPLIADETPEDNQFNLVQQVQGSYDPNDKTETHGGIITPEQVAGDEFLTYLIRFQNTGTDTAFNVMIRDTLTNKLDWSSFEMLSSSHPYQLYMIKPHILEFSFPNILLVDSNKNEQASHGFVAYRIKPKSNLAVGDTVLNRAHIYFDYNLPVITNDELTVLRNTVITSVIDIDRPDNQLLLYPNPSNGLVTIFKKGRLSGNANLQIIDMNGKVVHRSNIGQIATEQFNQTIDISNLPKGFYLIGLRVGKDQYTCRFIIQ